MHMLNIYAPIYTCYIFTVYTYIHVKYIYIYVHTHVNIYIYIHMLYIHIYTCYIYIHTYVNIYITYIYIYKYTRYIYIYVYIYTCYIYIDPHHPALDPEPKPLQHQVADRPMTSALFAAKLPTDKPTSTKLPPISSGRSRGGTVVPSGKLT